MVTLRAIKECDLETLLAMMRELAEHESEQHYLTVDKATLAAAGFGDGARWRGFFAEESGDAIGYVTYTEDFHIWSGDLRLALDDIYVRPGQRGKGVGEKLMRKIFDIAEAEGALVSWTVQPENKRAIGFYESLGAKVTLTGKCLWRAGDS